MSRYTTKDLQHDVNAINATLGRLGLPRRLEVGTAYGKPRLAWVVDGRSGYHDFGPRATPRELSLILDGFAAALGEVEAAGVRS